MNGEFRSIREVFSILEREKVNYLILRNFDNLLSDNLYMEGHGDIDCLCEDARHMANVLGARVYTNKTAQVCNDGTHYYILVRGKEVSLDLRHLGDGYYCEKWQSNMLRHKKEYNGFYVMNDEDYFYSLIYHAILQKPRFSMEYGRRLKEMAPKLGYEDRIYNVVDFINMLEKYMSSNGYKYTYPEDIFVPLHKKLINKQLIEPNCGLAWKHFKFDFRVSIWHFLVCLKHLNFKL